MLIQLQAAMRPAYEFGRKVDDRGEAVGLRGGRKAAEPDAVGDRDRWRQAPRPGPGVDAARRGGRASSSDAGWPA